MSVPARLFFSSSGQVEMSKRILRPMRSMERFHSSLDRRSRCEPMEAITSSSGRPSGCSRQPSPSRST